ncbi:efflux RND transporter permease subunit [uncultured Duncaniella sp.]|uniref:efflux RND transporter permease subunit n=1 Tax=uncultured Duncaniella sp. TaxID=2768039 RepID=UPI0026E586C8|nr:efflux RND transporter permease subunit [uncultured Duncaniella sp.]
MVRYLLNHRIAVIMAFLALVILGCVTYVTLPVSLLPDIAIPHITVQVSEENVSARELENTVVTPLRRQLMQVGGLSEIKSETRDGSAVIYLTMDYGVNTDLAFIEVNEKIDGAMNLLPRSVSRPKAVKASATDIPVLYIQMTSRTDRDEDFMDVATVAENIVRRRLEQLPEVAMVDMTGVPGRMLRVTPDLDKLTQAGISVEELESALTANNVEPGSMTVRDGYYEYNIHVANLLRSASDIRKIKIRKSDRMFDLGDFADVQLMARTPDGYSVHNGKRAVTLAIIKHSEESMDAMKKALDSALGYFSSRYPDIEFSQTRSQTELLDFTISNLEQNLILGLILVFFVCALFMGGVRSSFIIGLSIIVGVILTFLLFYLFHVSINIISMSGLILAVGMMIDNSVIVTENITQYRHRGASLMQACVSGTNEMITPMLSSSLTTVAVFVPLVFMSGIAGAIFSDQAFSITAGLASSYVVGITLLPVLYHIFSKKTTVRKRVENESAGYLRLYDRGIDLCFRHKWVLMILTMLMIPICVLLFMFMRHERMPEIDSNETLVRIDWNENISLDENRRRVGLLKDSSAVMNSAYIGPQDFLLASDLDFSSAEAELYFLTDSSDSIAPLQERVSDRLHNQYPNATFSFSKTENIFEKIFSSDEADIEVRIHSAGGGKYDIGDLLSLHQSMSHSTGISMTPVPLREQIDIIIDRERLALYNVEYSEVQRVLRTAFKGNSVSTLRSYNEYIPIEIVGSEMSINDVLAGSFVRSRADRNGVSTDIPLRSLLTTESSRDLKTITAGSAGEYVPVGLNVAGHENEVMQKVREVAYDDGNYDVDFEGSFFSNAKMMNELTVILLVSVMLMYFILCAQFESFLQPLIVLLEIPVDTAFALLALMIFGQTLNLMSAIGIIVTCGIVVNDSILKLDAINELRKDGMPLVEAIHTAGRRRLRAIIMTSLTTIVAMLPVLFTSDMGSELQRPLAIAMIGSMVVGTLVSIFIIPLFYWSIYRKHESK